jgi:hypothetical protein
MPSASDRDRDRYLETLRRLGQAREASDAAYELLESVAVLGARRAGLSWEQIAQALDRTRPSVWRSTETTRRGERIACVLPVRKHRRPGLSGRPSDQRCSRHEVTDPTGDLCAYLARRPVPDLPSGRPRE